MTTAKGLYKPSVQIQAAASISNAADTGGGALVGIYVPQAITGATISFQTASASDGTYYPVRDSAGNVISITINAVPSYYSLRGSNLFGMEFVKIVSASTEAALVNFQLIFQQIVD